MILEGVVTTRNDSGTVNIAAMGPIVDDAPERLVLRPFRSSLTFANLHRCGEGVFHVTDDVELLARAAVGALDPPPRLVDVAEMETPRLADCCRWYAFRIESSDLADRRARFDARVIASGRERDFFGLNRAMHAVVEAAILATRLGIIPHDEMLSELSRLAPLVEKTGGSRERRAFAFVTGYIQSNGPAGEARP